MGLLPPSFVARGNTGPGSPRTRERSCVLSVGTFCRTHCCCHESMPTGQSTAARSARGSSNQRPSAMTCGVQPDQKERRTCLDRQTKPMTRRGNPSSPDPRRGHRNPTQRVRSPGPRAAVPMTASSAQIPGCYRARRAETPRSSTNPKAATGNSPESIRQEGAPVPKWLLLIARRPFRTKATPP